MYVAGGCHVSMVLPTSEASGNRALVFGAVLPGYSKSGDRALPNVLKQ